MKTIYRYEVPVDDDVHEFELRGDIVHVAARQPQVVEFWAIHAGYGTVRRRHLVVYGTGQPIPDQAIHVGTAVVGPLVWHLAELAQK